MFEHRGCYWTADIGVGARLRVGKFQDPKLDRPGTCSTLTTNKLRTLFRWSADIAINFATFISSSSSAEVSAMSDGNRLNRRRVLQGAAAAGMSTVGVTGLASAAQNGTKSWKGVPTQRVGEAQFVEFGLEFDVDLEPGRPACHAPPYLIDHEAGEIVFPSIPEDEKATVDQASAVLGHQGLEPIPTNVTRSDVKHLPVRTAGHLSPVASVTVEEPIRIPAIRFDTSESAGITVSVGANDQMIEPGKSASIKLDPAAAKPRAGRGRNRGKDGDGGKGQSDAPSSSPSKKSAVPKVLVNNHGPMTWRVVQNVEGNNA